MEENPKNREKIKFLLPSHHGEAQQIPEQNTNLEINQLRQQNSCKDIAVVWRNITLHFYISFSLYILIMSLSALLHSCILQRLFQNFPFYMAKMIYFSEKKNDLQVNINYISI